MNRLPLRTLLAGAALAAATALLALASFAPVSAAKVETRPAHKLGDHPAVVVQRLQRSAGYDYASKFYPHPAWLYLSAQPRDDTAEEAQ